MLNNQVSQTKSKERRIRLTAYNFDEQIVHVAGDFRLCSTLVNEQKVLVDCLRKRYNDYRLYYGRPSFACLDDLTRH